MTEIAAVEPGGQGHSATFYRDQFLAYDTRPAAFFCSDCSVSLIPVLIFAPAEKPLGKSPHFRTPRGTLHVCGAKGPRNDGRRRGERGGIARKYPFTVPTEFSAPRQMLEGTIASSVGDRGPVGAVGSRTARRPRSPQAPGSVTHVQSLAEAHRCMVEWVYGLAREESWPDLVRKSQLDELLKSKPLNLRGRCTAYFWAFHRLGYAIPERFFVFHGKYARVRRAIDGTYRVVASYRARMESMAEADKVPFVLRVDLRDVDRGRLRGSCRATVAALDIAVRDNLCIHWYAYGRASKREDQIELSFSKSSLSDVCLFIPSR